MGKQQNINEYIARTWIEVLYHHYREDRKGRTPLLLAIKRKSLKVVELLLDEGVVSDGARGAIQWTFGF